MNYMKGRPIYKLVIVGDSSLMKRHLAGCFNENSHYWPTLLQTEQEIVFQTKRGPIRFNVCHTTGGHKHPVLRRMYHRSSDCAIIMCDVSSETTCDNVFLRITQLWDHCGRIPTVICGNKADSRNRTVFKLNPTVRKPNMQYFDISVKNNYCCSEPFLHLCY
ncbi:blast:GTP-binding nuclear protein ran-1 [Drosophila guanche]|uniref:Blast:GTP-binding nuclear protein ran-1 n=1 Tax=Drosophila guanche TaxID=7266 RepID=A0A3B0KYJ7_DROGU|nr:blast:GTP-binding nuclear protein ran-1 [Drosophila guanche]